MQNTDKNKDKNTNQTKKLSVRSIAEKLRDKDEVEVRARLRFCVDFALSATIAFLIGGARLLFSTYPLCIVLLCSSRKRLLPIFTGLFILCLCGGLPDVFIFASIATPLIRVLLTYMPIVLSEAKETPVSDETAMIKYAPDLPEKSELYGRSDKGRQASGSELLFNEKLYLRALSAAAAGLLCGLFLLIGQDFSFYALWGTLFLTAACPALTFVLAGFFGGKESAVKHYPTVSLGAIGMLCVFVARSMTVIGMPMAPFLAMLLTLCATSAYGLFPGGVAAILFGIVLDPVYMPLLVICSILFFLVSAVRRGAGLAVVCAAVVVWCYYIGGADGLVGILPPMLLAIPVYMIVDKYREIMCAPYNRAMMAGGVYFAEAVTEKNKNLAVRERLSALSDVFATLSETFYKLSDKRRRPDALGLKRICEATFDSVCRECRGRELCYGSEYPSTIDTITRMTVALHKKGAVDKCDLDSKFLSRCTMCERLIDGTNRALACTTESIIKDGNLSFFASSYEDINEILRDALENDGEEYEADPDAADKICDLLFEEGFRTGGVVVWGKRCKNIVIKGIPSADKLSARRADMLRCKIGEIVGATLGEPSFETGRDGAVMRLSSKPLYRACCARGNIPAQSSPDPILDTSELYVDPFKDPPLSDEVCGDTSNSFVTSSSYFYSLISDGMGSGEEAAFVSGVCSMFIEKMLLAGNRADITVKMLGNVLRNENMGRGGECSATVDLCELDLISGTASFIKSGAAPTYIARGSTVFKVYSRTMPIGILKEADTKISKFDTKRGDVIIMMSDGCCPDSEDCPWLVEFLCEYMARKDKNALGSESECEILCQRLLALAKQNTPKDKTQDDISVTVTIIE
ncbi:MAG: SpoIIE family protein phosphatase [Clostridia bacterium]|nr:SpoIIE family protein phosphatase [Clostridia bacterium]